ncbi:MAG TPA: TonB-dependent receptor [Terriglobales bacterium]|nr:TonB-dependent receptor [Terriglobales bacterium]
MRDPSGAAIVGAQVRLLSQGKAPVRSVETDGSGAFRLEGVPAGSYELVAVAHGMQAASAAVAVPQKESKPVEMVLQVASVNTSVTVTAARGEVETVGDLATQVNVVGPDALAQRPGAILPQALREEVGVMVQQTSAHQGAVVVRGLTGQQVVHLIDGIRFNNSTFRPGPNQYFALVDPSYVERVEILRGPASAQYGSDGLGGSVNVVPARTYLQSGDRRLRGEFMPVFRTADLAGAGSLRLSYGDRNWNLAGGGAGRRVQDLKAAGDVDSHAAVTRFLGLPSSILGERLQDTAFTQWSGFLQFFWNPKPGHSLMSSYTRTEQLGGRRYDQLNGGNGNLINSFHPQILDFFYARYEKQKLGFLDTLSGTFSYNSQRDDRREQGGSGNPLAAITSEFNDTDVFGYQALATTHIGARQSIAFGGEIYDEYIESTRDRFSPTNGTTTAVRGRYPNGTRYNTYGLFYQHGLEVVPNRLRVQGGVRYSAFQYRSFADKNLTDASGQHLVPDFSTTLHDVTFNVGAVLRLTSQLSFFGTVRRGFRAPNTTDFASVGITSNGFEVSPDEAGAGGGQVGSTGDAAAVGTGESAGSLSPEVLYNYEVGFRVQASRITASVSAFTNEISDFITRRTLILPAGAVGETIGGQIIINQLPTGAVITSADPRPVLVRANVGDVRIWGTEAALQAQLSRAWTANANFYYLRGQDKQTGGPPDLEGGLPPASGFLSLRWQPTRRRFWIEGYSLLAGKQDRLSTLELADQRIGATRSVSSITAFFNNGAVARGLVNNGILLATGETLSQVVNRVLGPGVTSAPLYTKTPGFGTLNLRGGFRVSEQSQVLLTLENLLDKNYRFHGSGVDAPGVNLQVAYRIRF